MHTSCCIRIITALLIVTGDIREGMEDTKATGFDRLLVCLNTAYHDDLMAILSYLTICSEDLKQFSLYLYLRVFVLMTYHRVSVILSLVSLKMVYVLC